jgi:hypothetical protein
MPPYDLINTNYSILGLAIGIGVAVLVILARCSAELTWSFGRREIDQPVHEFGGGVSERDGPIPIAIWLVLGAVAVWSVGYILVSGAQGL